MRMLADDDDDTTPTASSSKSQGSQQPAWMRTLLDRCRQWIEVLPAKFNTLAKQSSENEDPLHRLFSREGRIGRRLLVQVQKDLNDVIKVCQGELKQTNHLRTLMSCLTKGRDFFLRQGFSNTFVGTIPDHWRRYKVGKAMAVSGWIADLSRRLAQLDSIAGLDNLNNVEVWLGGLFFPEAYITATRQAVAHRKKWSLETLHLRLDMNGLMIRELSS
ncbi:dynein heavy chain domain-containing protein [Mycena haematopus]|nr:dynein heavy chain domain-containing protein [Mycena haematopus]